MAWILFLLGAAMGSVVRAQERQQIAEDTLRKVQYDSITERLSPFWIETMIPVILCLLVVFIIAATFGVAILVARELRDNEPVYKAFDSVAFDAVWERNTKPLVDQARFPEDGALPSDDNLNSPIEVVTVYPNAAPSGKAPHSHTSIPEAMLRPVPADNAESRRTVLNCL
jgi:hypothetical protein